ncbi:helix-turn-helix domain-containing protein [Dyadobacter sp. LHD-138]|uniref:helix-turn-helix domain-containing protein n=1 Tax=Dyadobacter sp. LHD-138 TaxID=3071413 RepID=UPI0027E1C6EA|nr:helix-turn-helix domain-containing protein [Dyadobacter sp. LHD-138]MDQ6479987.1 helix-turn-helix domain-containing protein [Dyadobacter sp. LHD-138]
MTTKGKESEKRNIMFANQLVTTVDLENFKVDMLDAIRKMIKTDQGLPAKKWLKSSEVRKMLDISPGKLHMLRASRKLAFMRLGGIIYYDREDIIKMFESNKTPVAKNLTNR